MIIKSVELQNFRNYSLEKIEFDKSTNILYGDNAQGKTNILEAIFVSATTKSHKSSKDNEMIAFNNNEAHIKTLVSRNDIDYRIDIHLKKNKSKGIAINGVPVKRAMDLYGIVNIIFFSPEDLNIIAEGPALRRRFIDMELCQLDRIYADNLIKYNKALNQRNKLLKDIYYNESLKDTLDIWDMQIVNYGREIISRRRQFIKELNGIMCITHSKLTGNVENINIDYEMSVNEENFEKIIAEGRNKDIKFGMTSYGPHRDDIIFDIDGIDVRKYGSQGQKRTTALSLKLAEIELVKQKIGEMPILLLDDVLSELDSKRQNYLLNSLNGVQTIITCTGLDEFIDNRFEINKIYKVVKGKVCPYIAK